MLKVCVGGCLVNDLEIDWRLPLGEAIQFHIVVSVFSPAYVIYAYINGLLLALIYFFCLQNFVLFCFSTLKK